MAHLPNPSPRMIFVTILLASLAVSSAAFAQPTFDKTFSPDTISSGGISTLTFTIDNSAGFSTRNLAFVDNLPSVPGQMTIATPANASTTCFNGEAVLSITR